MNLTYEQLFISLFTPVRMISRYFRGAGNKKAGSKCRLSIFFYFNGFNEQMFLL